ncbi:LuxR C-terminal-related transcriptional regulator [Streptomyces sp. NPDC056291]|uniref:LuxR C-terminal-related transcriptional regulator n=1 Tax=Streptomyces sp. NPDC056291 TaxID=3345772 RepID=UPI0035D7E824
MSALDEDIDRLYRVCIRTGAATLDAVARHLAWTTEATRRRVDQLRALGLIEEVDGRISALPPRGLLRGLAADLESAAEDARRRASEWGSLWQQHREQASYLEVLGSDGAAAAADDELLKSAREEVRALQVGPISVPIRDIAPAIPDGFFNASRRGVRFRVIYGIDILRDPDGLAAVQSCVMAGEDARAFAEIPLNLSIADDKLALITFAGDALNARNAVLVHPSGLLDSLSALFESYWRMASPISPASTRPGGQTSDDDNRRLLAYLNAGLTDEAIARELDVSERTVGRRISRLQDMLGVASRFQLGSQAARRGWV